MMNIKKSLSLLLVLSSSALLFLGCGGGSSSPALSQLSIESVVYDDNNTVAVEDDSLSIYFNRSIDINVTNVKEEISNNFDIDGLGELGSAVSADYNDTFFHRLKIMLDNNSTKFIAGETKISFASTNKWEGVFSVNKTPVTIIAPKVVLVVGQGSYSEANGTVTDLNTGLVWEKEDNATETDWADANIYCEELELEGLTWRLPTIDELIGLTDKNASDPAIDPIFTNTKNSQYWTGSEYLGTATDDAWSVNFTNANTNNPDKNETHYVRCVSSDVTTTSSPYTRDSVNQVVLDTSTNLMWEDTPDTIDTNSNKGWEEAITQCEDLELAGYDDWRLPNINELDTITDKSTYGPAMSSEFKYRASLKFWSSTVEQTDSVNKAWYTYFWCGCNDFQEKTTASQVRCVRSVD